MAFGCGTAPDVERINENDPDSNRFKPDEPTTFGRIITKDKWVILRWKDNSKFEDGYLVEKRIFENDEFTILDTLNANNTSYTDKSKLLSPSTAYKISPIVYRNANDSTNVNRGDSILIDLDIGPLGDLSLSKKNGLIWASWENALEYFDALIIGYVDITNAPDKLIVVDTLTNKEINLEDINRIRKTSINIPKEGFTYKINMQAAVQVPGGDYVSYSTEEKKIKVNNPKIVNYEYLDEENLNIQWHTDVSGVEKFNIYNEINYPDTTYFSLVSSVDGSVNTYDINRIFTDNGISIAIEAVKKNDRSEIKTTWIDFNYRNLENFSLNPLDNSVELTWKIPTPIQPYTRFLLERSVNGSDFKVYKEFEPNIEKYTDTDIYKNDIYTYRIKSASSDYSRIKQAGYALGLTLQNRFSPPNDYVTIGYRLSPDKQQVGWINNEEKAVYLSDLKGNIKKISRPGFDFSTVRFSKDNRLLLLSGDSAGVVYTKILDRQSFEEKYSLQREYAWEPLLPIPNSNKIVTSHYNSKISEIKIIDFSTGKESILTNGIDGSVISLYYDDLSNNLLLRLYDKLIIYDIANKSIQKELSLPYEKLHVDYDSDSGSLKYYLDGEVRVYDIKTGNISTVFDVRNKILGFKYQPIKITSYAEINKGIYAFVTSIHNTIYCYDKNMDQVYIASGGNRSSYMKIYFLAEKNQIISLGSLHGLSIYNIEPKWTEFK